MENNILEEIEHMEIKDSDGTYVVENENEQENETGQLYQEENTIGSMDSGFETGNMEEILKGIDSKMRKENEHLLEELASLKN